MLRRAALLAIWMLLSILLLAQISADKKPAATSSNHLPDTALMQQIQNAWATLNPAEAARYYDKSPSDVFFDDAGGVKFQGWQAYDAAMRKLMADEQTAKWIVNDDAVVHAAGNYAWGTATVHAEMGYKNGTHQTLEERWTLVWERKNGEWLVVHEHFSAPLEEH